MNSTICPGLCRTACGRGRSNEDIIMNGCERPAFVVVAEPEVQDGRRPMTSFCIADIAATVTSSVRLDNISISYCARSRTAQKLKFFFDFL